MIQNALEWLRPWPTVIVGCRDRGYKLCEGDTCPNCGSEEIAEYEFSNDDTHRLRDRPGRGGSTKGVARNRREGS